MNFNILGGFQKILWIFLGGHHNIGLYLEVISMHFRVFSDVVRQPTDRQLIESQLADKNWQAKKYSPTRQLNDKDKSPTRQLTDKNL